MKLLGIDFVPLNLPLKKHLETFSAFFVAFFLFPGLVYTAPLIVAYILFFTKYWILLVVYFFWTARAGTSNAESGLHYNNWVSSWRIFKYAANYYPVSWTSAPGFYLDPKRSYIACVFPHGMSATGPILGIATDAIGTRQKISPQHTLHGATLRIFFYVPFIRDVTMMLGLCSTSVSTLNNLLSNPNYGRILGIVVGGTAEAFACCKEEYRIVVKNRKGFVKLALKHGAPLIPMFVFGETKIWNMKIYPKGTLMRKFQDFTKSSLGLQPIMVWGRGLFQYSFGFVPHQNPLSIVAGLPIDVEKVENPTQEQIDSLHALFVERLTALFEEYKYHFEQNPETVKLIIN